MTQYIDKSALIAEIEKCYNECLKRAKITDSEYWNAKADAYRNVLAILNDTIEVKEVDLEKEIDIYYNALPGRRNHIEMIAEHFFELGIKSKEEVTTTDDALIDKACEWLSDNMYKGACEQILSKKTYPFMRLFVEDFKQAMKGE